MSLIKTNSFFEEIKHGQSSVMLSSLQEYYHPIVPNGFGVKYVADGIERYSLDREAYDVSGGNYLLSNTLNEGLVVIDSDKPVQGICINIDKVLLQETIASVIRPDAATPDKDLGEFFTTSLFIENIYAATETQLGKALMQLNLALQQKKVSLDSLSAEFFYSISEKIVADYTPVCRQLQRIPSVKANTKKDLYKKVSKGKNFIDSCYMAPLTIEMIAKECCMSEYHFFRLFKLIFRVSPHQYIIHKRLERGKKMIGEYHLPVSAAAVDCGFSDIHTFSTAFRKHFGFTPSSLLAKK
jgi:AraC family transcriptional regulator